MDKKETKNSKGQVLTDRMDVDTKEFNEFQAILLNKSKERSNERKKMIELTALNFKMEDYVNSENNHSKSVGDFLKSYLIAFDIRQNKFAEYIGIRPSNLTKLIKGERSLNHEMAMIFGTIFGNDPMIWLDIQNKNKLHEVSKTKRKELNKYSLDDLTSKVE